MSKTLLVRSSSTRIRNVLDVCTRCVMMAAVNGRRIICRVNETKTNGYERYERRTRTARATRVVNSENTRTAMRRHASTPVGTTPTVRRSPVRRVTARAAADGRPLPRTTEEWNERHVRGRAGGGGRQPKPWRGGRALPHYDVAQLSAWRPCSRVFLCVCDGVQLRWRCIARQTRWGGGGSGRPYARRVSVVGNYIRARCPPRLSIACEIKPRNHRNTTPTPTQA